MAPTSSNDHVVLAGSLGLATAVGAISMWLYQRQEKNRMYRIPAELRSAPPSKELSLAVRMAIEAGKNIAAYCEAVGTEAEEEHDLDVSNKTKPEDFCTKIDILNEHIITNAIREEFPTHKIIGEESTGTGTIPPLTKEKTWVIDPIDGTTNFSVGFPLCCVSIGFCVDGKPVMGVVYSPQTNELYMAVKGHGAFRNGVRLSKRKHIEMTKAVVLFEFGYVRDPVGISKMTKAVQKVMEAGCLGTRQIGAGVLDLCYVATGRSNVVYSGIAESWKPWDYCAGVVIAQETGCVIESFHQKPGEDFDIFSKSSICAVSKELLKQCKKIIL